MDGGETAIWSQWWIDQCRQVGSRCRCIARLYLDRNTWNGIPKMKADTDCSQPIRYPQNKSQILPSISPFKKSQSQSSSRMPIWRVTTIDIASRSFGRHFITKSLTIQSSSLGRTKAGNITSQSTKLLPMSL